VHGVHTITVPYHLDEWLPDLDLPFDAAQTVTATLPGGDEWDRLAALYQAVAGPVSDAVSGGDVPLVLSGDCTTALGTMAGLHAAGTQPAVVWFDAHGDVQTVETTTSGYLAGMSLRLLTEYRPELIATRLGLTPVPEQRILLVDARDLDPPEASYLAGAQIRRAQVAGLTAADLSAGPLYVHVDLDVIAPAELPGLRFPAPGGPSVDQVAAALRLIVDTGRVAAVGLACSWYPGHAAAARVRPPLAAALGLAS
jgi:arginase